MTILYFVRHGQTDWNIQHRFQGQPTPDIPLNDEGRAQAAKIATALASHNIRFDHVFSSTQIRAIETANIIAASRNVTPQTDARLNEIHFGDYEGYTSADFKPLILADGMTGEELRRRHKSLDPHYDDTRHPGGESKQEVRARVQAALADIAAQTSAAALVVMHNAAFRIVMSSWDASQAADSLDHHHLVEAYFESPLEFISAKRLAL